MSRNYRKQNRGKVKGKKVHGYISPASLWAWQVRNTSCGTASSVERWIFAVRCFRKCSINTFSWLLTHRQLPDSGAHLFTPLPGQDGGGAQLFKTWLFSEPMIARHSFMPSHIVIATLCVDPTITFILEMKEAWFREVRNFACITQVADRKSCTLSKENLLSSYTQIFVLCIPKEINIKQAFLLEIRSKNN